MGGDVTHCINLFNAVPCFTVHFTGYFDLAGCDPNFCCFHLRIFWVLQCSKATIVVGILSFNFVTVSVDF